MNFRETYREDHQRKLISGMFPGITINQTAASHGAIYTIIRLGELDATLIEHKTGDGDRFSVGFSRIHLTGRR